MLRSTRQTFPTCVLLLTLLAALLLACDGGGTLQDVPPPLWDELVFAEPLLVVPGLRWFLDEDGGGWYFQNRATLLVPVRDAAEETLVLTLRGESVGLGQRFRIAWDDEALADEKIRIDDDTLVVQLDPALLQPGSHRLTLNRDHPSEKPGARGRPKSVFDEISFRRGDEAAAMKAADFDRYRLIADFLQHAVAGKGKERRGGLLFVGPARHTLKLSRARRARLLVSAENDSQASAKFTVAVAGGSQARAEVARAGSAEMAVEVPAGESELVLSVEGDPGGLFLWGMPRLAESRTAKLPPIVLVTLDTTRRDALGPYNGDPDSTPVIDRFAQESTVFDEAFSTAPWTLPSHASIMTGLYPSRHRAGVTEVRLRNGAATLARLLRERGYFTAGFSAGELSSSRFGLAQGFHYYRNPDKFETPGGDLAGYVEETLDAHAGEPLFLFVNYFDAHALYDAPPEYEAKLGVEALREKLGGKVWDDLLGGQMSAWREIVEGESEVTGDGAAYLKAAYLAEVSWVDHLLGRLFQKLRDLGLYERALIVVTADHGELLGEGGFYSHGARLDPELVEVPLFVKWPGVDEPRRSARLTSLVDLYPTILAAAGVEAPPSDALAIPPPGTAGDAETHPYLLLEEHLSLVHPLPKNMMLARHLFGVQRTGFRQLVWEGQQSCARRDGAPRGPWLGVDCETDVGKVVAAIEERLGSGPRGTGDEVLDDLKDMLKKLGYI